MNKPTKEEWVKHGMSFSNLKTAPTMPKVEYVFDPDTMSSEFKKPKSHEIAQQAFKEKENK